MTSIAYATFTITSLGIFLIAILLNMNMIMLLGMQLFLIMLFRSIMVVTMLMEWIAVLMDQGVEFRGLVKRF